MEEHVDSPRTAWSGDLEGELPWMQELACHLVRDREAARELVQDAWLQALERPPRAQDRPRAWISTVMRNLVRQVGRRSVRRGRVVADADELSDTRPLPSQELERRELWSALQGELLQLAEPYRSTLRDHFQRGLSSAEIARRRGLPPGTVRWRMKVGLDRLRERLDERYGGRVRWTSALVALLPRGDREPGSRSTPPHAAPLPSPGPSLIPLGSLSLVGLAVIVGGTSRGTPPELTLPPLELAARTGAPVELDRDPASPSEVRIPLEAPLAGATQPAESTPQPSAGLSALVLEIQDAGGTPLAGAELRVGTREGFEPRGTSDARGRIEVALAPDDFGALAIPAARDHVAVRAHAAGHAASQVLFVPRSFGAGEPLALALGGPERILGGRVADEDGSPLADVDVFALPDPLHTSLADPDEPFCETLALGTRTDADGRYELAGLSQSEQVLCVRRPGAESVLLPAERQQSQVMLRLAAGGTVRGRILDEHGQPARGALVWIEPLQRGTEWCAGLPGYFPELRGFGAATTTDAEGFYELSGLQPRERRIYARSATDPDQVANATVRIEPEGVAAWSTFLAREAGIRLRLLDSESEPLGGWIVQLLSLRGAGPRWVRRLESDAAGFVSVPEASAEADLVVYDPSGLGQPWLTQRVRPGSEVQTLLVDKGRFGIVAGKLLDASGNVPPGARLEAYEANARLAAPIRIDRGSGRFRSRLERGEYTLMLRTEHGGAPLGRAVVRGGGKTRLGYVAPPELGELRLRAERPGNRQGNYRLWLCFGLSSAKWKEGALPLFAEEAVHAGLYRCDVSGTDGLLQTGWATVRANEVTELDLERLASVLVEVHAPEGAAGSCLLTVTEAGAPHAEGAEPVRCVSIARCTDGRFVHVLRLPPGAWNVSAQIGSATRLEAQVEVFDGTRTTLRLGSP